MAEYSINLGKTGIQISPIGLGTMQWGDIKLPTKYDSPLQQDIRQISEITLNAGINFFDTAEMYGRGRSESHLGRLLTETTNKVIVATKFMPFPWRLSKGELRSALLHSLKRLGLSQVDLYQMHWPFPPVAIASWMDAMADAFDAGLIRAVGVSNYSASQTINAIEVLARHKIPLASNQVKYNLLDRRPEKSGLVEVCAKYGVAIIAYSPLEKGILTGKYAPNNPPRGLLSWRYNRSSLKKIDPLMDAIGEIGKRHSNKTPSQVALNWLICKGAVPIPGARNVKQAQENAGGMGWRMSGDEIALLDEVSNNVTG